MTRWTLVAIAVSLAACNRGDRDRLSRNASDSAAAADSAVTMPDSAMSSDSMSGDVRPADSTSVQKTAASGAKTLRPAADTNRTTPARASDTRTGEGPTGAEAMTGVRPAPSGTEAIKGVRAAPAVHDLSADQAKQLQAALNKAGCDAGTADGVMGRQTQRAISCGLKKYKLDSNDMSGLYRKLGLDF